MAEKFYSAERNVQILVALLKAHGIRYVIASPGTTNINFVASVQCDSFFTVFSSVDERSAAYMACGIASESGEPVVITCTGATASRNYISGLTEAYYRKLPILAVTATQNPMRIGHLHAQVIDRSRQQADTVLKNVLLGTVKSDEDAWHCEIKANDAILELRHRGGGPVLINLETTYNSDFTLKELPAVKVINRITPDDEFPELDERNKRIAIFVGSHRPMTKDETATIDRFCGITNAIVLCDLTSGYHGRYEHHGALFASQYNCAKDIYNIDLLIHIGEVSGDYPMTSIRPQEVWRISPDGELRDPFHTLRYIFEMNILTFFGHYVQKEGASMCQEFFNQCETLRKKALATVPDLPFSNVWIASQSANCIPENSTLHVGILNTLRCWNYFEVPKSVRTACNVGGFGIDGDMSALIGASLVNPTKLYFLIVGDLAFFYDMNVLGNRHLGKNIRIMLINNGRGTEFHNFDHPAAKFGEDGDPFMAAAGHFGNKSKDLVKHYAQDLGFEYLSASDKKEYLSVRNIFFQQEIKEKPILLEVFTDSDDESTALKLLRYSLKDGAGSAKELARKILGQNLTSKIGRFIGK